MGRGRTVDSSRREIYYGTLKEKKKNLQVKVESPFVYTPKAAMSSSLIC